MFFIVIVYDTFDVVYCYCLQYIWCCLFLLFMLHLMLFIVIVYDTFDVVYCYWLRYIWYCLLFSELLLFTTVLCCYLKQISILLLFIIQCIEDRNLLVGYLNMYNENYNTAQNLFLKSSNPKAALEVYNNYYYYYYYILLLLFIDALWLATMGTSTWIS